MLADIDANDDKTFSFVCQEHNWKRTAQRRAVFGYLCGNRDHPTVETIWRGVKVTMPDISLDSIYRILDAFSEAGLIRRLEGAKVIRYDSDTQSHEHFVCTQCERMFDLGSLEIERVIKSGCEFGRIETVELIARGTCRLCLEKQESAGSKTVRIPKRA